MEGVKSLIRFWPLHRKCVYLSDRNFRFMDIDKAYLDRFENRMQDEMLKVCTSKGMLDGVLLSGEDIDGLWKVLAPEYVADAVVQVQDYPVVSLAWAAYLGMAVAYGWDADWAVYSKKSYQSYYGQEGYDDMDEHIVRDLLGLALDGDEAIRLAEVLRSCAQSGISLIRHEGIEPQSPLAFHVFARACRVMFRIGAAIQLRRMGYKFEKVDL